MSFSSKMKESFELSYPKITRKSSKRSDGSTVGCGAVKRERRSKIVSILFLYINLQEDYNIYSLDKL